MRPVLGRLKVSTRLMRVLLPAPEEPTRAVVEPAGAWNDTCLSTSRSATYWKLTSSKRTSPTTSPSGGRAASAAASVGGRRGLAAQGVRAAREHEAQILNRDHLQARYHRRFRRIVRRNEHAGFSIRLRAQRD